MYHQHDAPPIPTPPPPPFYPPQNTLHEGEIVVVQILSLNVYYAQCILLEYSNAPARILYSELSKRNFGGALSKLCKVGSRECCCVLPSKDPSGELNLSKKRVIREVQQQAFQRYQKSKMVFRIMEEFVEQMHGAELPTRKVANDTQMTQIDHADHSPGSTAHTFLNHYFTNIVYPCHTHYGHCWDAFKMCLKDSEQRASIFATIFNPQKTCWRDLSKDDLTRIQNALFECIGRRLKIRPTKMRCHIEVSSFAENGIDNVKNALMCAKQCDPDMQVSLIAHPVFAITCFAEDEHEGRKLLIRAMQCAKDSIMQVPNSKFKVLQPPNIVDRRMDNTLNIIMQQLEAENKEVDGDHEEEEGIQFEPPTK